MWTVSEDLTLRDLAAIFISYHYKIIYNNLDNKLMPFSLDKGKRDALLEFHFFLNYTAKFTHSWLLYVLES